MSLTLTEEGKAVQVWPLSFPPSCTSFLPPSTAFTLHPWVQNTACKKHTRCLSGCPAAPGTENRLSERFRSPAYPQVLTHHTRTAEPIQPSPVCSRRVRLATETAKGRRRNMKTTLVSRKARPARTAGSGCRLQVGSSLSHGGVTTTRDRPRPPPWRWATPQPPSLGSAAARGDGAPAKSPPGADGKAQRGNGGGVSRGNTAGGHRGKGAGGGWLHRGKGAARGRTPEAGTQRGGDTRRAPPRRGKPERGKFRRRGRREPRRGLPAVRALTLQPSLSSPSSQKLTGAKPGR